MWIVGFSGFSYRVFTGCRVQHKENTWFYQVLGVLCHCPLMTRPGDTACAPRAPCLTLVKTAWLEGLSPQKPIVGFLTAASVCVFVNVCLMSVFVCPNSVSPRLRSPLNILLMWNLTLVSSLSVCGGLPSCPDRHRSLSVWRCFDLSRLIWNRNTMRCGMTLTCHRSSMMFFALMNAWVLNSSKLLLTFYRHKNLL